MSTPVEQIKARLSIVDVVGSYIKLDKAGSSFKALCPFHNEKSPSFNVSPSRDAYYCFGCNRGGDIFSFVEEIEGIEFVDALKLLADRAGVTLTHDIKENKSEREHLASLMEEATLFYERQLLQNTAVKAYLVDRGLTEETVRSFRIGFAPLEWRAVYDHLRSKHFSDAEIEKAGLVKPTEGKEPYDRFRGRVMFPIFDANGRVVAFSGRVFGEQKNKDGSDVAKYINSPETPLYDKSSIMFGYDRAKRAIRTQNFTILVEGQMDLIMSHQAGTENTVAVSGTALTEKHLTLLKRLSDNLVFAFDADEAGLRATARAFRLALALGMACYS
jgi:DNA primase